MMSSNGQLTTLICFALKEEAAPFRKIAGGKPGVEILVTGVGRKNARSAIEKSLAERKPARVLTCGLAGGLADDLKIGDIRIETEDAALREKLAAAGAKPAKFFCAERVAVTAEEKRLLRGATGAEVVEMESAEIQAVCREQQIPCATVRVVSDLVNEDLPLDFNALAGPDMSLDYGKLAWALAKSPGKIGALRSLQKQVEFAAEKLALLLGTII